MSLSSEIMLNVAMLSFVEPIWWRCNTQHNDTLCATQDNIILNSIYAERRNYLHYAECRYVACRNAECRGAKLTFAKSKI